MTPIGLNVNVDVAAARLWVAAETATPCAPVRDLLGSADVATAYRAQAINLERELSIGHIRIGRKIGLTSEVVQRQLGVDQPDFGSLLDHMLIDPAGVVPSGRLLQPKVEAEIAFRLGRDLDRQLDSIEDVRAAVTTATAAIEIVDSRISGWDITIVDTVADNASSGLFVVSDTSVNLSDFDPRSATMTLEVNGQRTSSGTGSDCLGDPLAALLWLARTARDLGDPLRAGEIILSGALGPMTSVAPGDHVRTTISGLGSVEVGFGETDSRRG